jgi:hypothetical protein
MSTLEIANELVSLVKEGKNAEAIEKLYSADIVSVEAVAGPEGDTVTGIEAVQGKLQWWMNSMEVHEAKVDGPFVNGDQFAVKFDYDVTDKASGQRYPMIEVAIYTVADGKISHERFFYNM